MTNPSSEAREAAEKLELWYYTQGLSDRLNKKAIKRITSIIQAAIDSAQRPYVEWIMKCEHAHDCSTQIDVRPMPCDCGLDELRKQVGGEHG